MTVLFILLNTDGFKKQSLPPHVYVSGRTISPGNLRQLVPGGQIERGLPTNLMVPELPPEEFFTSFH